MPTVRPNVRVHAVVVVILLCITLGFVATTRTEKTAARIFFGAFGIVIAVALIYTYRKEAMLAHDHMIGAARVTDVMIGRRGGRMIKYRFVALNGLEYTGESNYWGRLPILVGADVVVVYSPLQPTVNRLLKQFLFYSLQPYGS